MADYRILHQDPSYERIRGQRRARSLGFFATIAGWLCLISIGAIFLFAPLLGELLGEKTLLMPPCFFAAWVVLKLAAKFLHTKYWE